MGLYIAGKLYDINQSDADNPVVTELYGWHVNSDTELPELSAFLVTPSQPKVIFAEPATTYFYRFESEQQANELLGLNE